MITAIKPTGTSTLISNNILNDKRLSYGARGLLCVIIHQDKTLTHPELLALTSDSPATIQMYLNELEYYNYVNQNYPGSISGNSNNS